MWNRWTREYVRGLREQPRLSRARKTPNQPSIAIGEVVIINDDQKPRNVWKLAVVNQLITGRDGTVRAAKLKTGNGYLERAIQHLYPLELACDKEQTIQLNPKAPEFTHDPKEMLPQQLHYEYKKLPAKIRVKHKHYH